MRVKRVNAGIRAISEIYSFMINDNSWWWGRDGSRCRAEEFLFLFEKYIVKR